MKKPIQPRRVRSKEVPNRMPLMDSYLVTLEPREWAFMVWDTAQPGLGVRIQPTGTKTFKVAYYHQGRLRWYTIGRFGRIGVNEARKAARQILAKAALGEDPQGDKIRKRRALTFRELVKRYLEEGAPAKSRLQYERQLMKYALPAFGSEPAAELDQDEVRVLLAGRARKAPASANLLHAAISSAYRWGIAEGYVKSNPARELRTTRRNASRERTLDPREIAPFWQALEGLSPDRATALRVILLAGQRPGEVIHMRRQDLEIGEHVFDYVTRDARIIQRRHSGAWWNMAGQPSKDGLWPGTKNGQRHRIWLTEGVLELLALLPSWSAVSGYLFPGKRRDQPITNLDSDMRKISEALRLEPPVTPHDLRRTHGTMTTRLGFSRDAMDRCQNHHKAGIGSVYDRHDYADEARRVQEAVGKRLLELATRAVEDNVVQFRA